MARPPQRTYPPGVPCWLDLSVPNPDVASSFYAGLFGWELADRLPPQAAPDRYLVASLDGAEVAAIGSIVDDVARSAAASGPPAWRTYVGVASADDAAAAALAAGGRVLVEPFDVGPPGRMAILADPAGAVLAVWQAGARTGPGAVNEPGTWNWSDLHTADVGGAVAFYSAVFGWEARPVAMGGFEATMWCVPGYGDFQAERDPSLRDRHANDGVPEGFADAIGWLIPGNEAPHWHVTFAVADADAVTTRAEQLGGTVVEPPRTEGPTRLAELADPTGARFTVSAYRP